MAPKIVVVENHRSYEITIYGLNSLQASILFRQRTSKHGHGHITDKENRGYSVSFEHLPADLKLITDYELNIENLIFYLNGTMYPSMDPDCVPSSGLSSI